MLRVCHSPPKCDNIPAFPTYFLPYLWEVFPDGDWDTEARPIPTPPADHTEWMRECAGKLPFNPDHDEAIYAKVPAYHYANPHFRKTQCYTLEERPLDGHDSFTPGPFPHTHISDWRHLGNIVDQQKEMVLKNFEQILALVPHGGGRAYMKQGMAPAKLYEKFLRSIRFAGYDGEAVDVKVIPPDMRNGGSPNSKNPFAQPWTFFVLLEDDTGLLMRMFLLWQEHFAVDQSCSFSIYPLITDHPQSWKLLVLTWPHANWATATHNEVIDKGKVTLEVLKSKLRVYSFFRDEIAMLAATKINHTGSRDQVFQTVTDFFHLKPATADTKDGPCAAFVLLARPLADTSQELKHLKKVMLEALCGCMRGDHFYVGTNKVFAVDDASPTATTSVDCKLCKSDIHCTVDCLLPKARGWHGITAAALGCDNKPDKESAASTLKNDPREVVNSVLTAIRGDSKALGSMKGKNTQGKPNGGGRRGRGQSGHGGGKRKGPAHV